MLGSCLVTNRLSTNKFFPVLHFTNLSDFSRNLRTDAFMFNVTSVTEMK